MAQQTARVQNLCSETFGESLKGLVHMRALFDILNSPTHGQTIRHCAHIGMQVLGELLVLKRPAAHSLVGFIDTAGNKGEWG